MKLWVKSIAAILLAALVAFPLSGCVMANISTNNWNNFQNGTVRGEGPVKTETIQFSEFTHVLIDANMEVVYEYSEKYAVKLEMQESLFTVVTATQNEKRVFVKSKSHIIANAGEEPRLVIQAPTLQVLDIRGTSVLNISDSDMLKADDLQLLLSGSVNGGLRFEGGSLEVGASGVVAVEFTGTAENMKLDVSGNGTINALGLEAQNAEVSVSGSGEVSLHAVKALDITISGSGTIGYKGTPAITQRVSGFGTINTLP